MGTLPQGLPPFTIPSVSASDFGLLVAGALGISLVALTDTISTASAFAARSGDEVQANQEMIGIGTANVAAGLFQGFPVSTSGSRTAVADQSGAKTQITGLVGAAVIVLMLVVVPGLFRNLPQPTLAAVVMAAALSLADLAGMKRLWKVRRTEFALSIAAFFGVAVLGVLPGIAIAVGLSILNVFRRSWWPYSTSWGGSREFPAITTCGPIRMPNGSKVSSCSASMPPCSLPMLGPSVSRSGSWPRPTPRLAGSWWPQSPSPTSTQRQRTCSRTSTSPSTGTGISLVFAEMKDPVRAKIERYELTRTIDPMHFFPTIESALVAFAQSPRVEVDVPPGEMKEAGRYAVTDVTRGAE